MLQRYDFKIPFPMGLSLVGEVFRMFGDSQADKHCSFCFENQCLQALCLCPEWSGTGEAIILYEEKEVCRVCFQDMGLNSRFIISGVVKKEGANV